MIVLAPPRHPGVRVAIDPDRGATVRSWAVPLTPRAPVRERLWLESWADSPSPPDLPGGIPVLFPFAGRVAAPPGLVPGTWTWGGVSHAGMPIHGFAWRLPWKTVRAGRASADFRLASTPDTLALYPFPFTLALRVKIHHPAALSLTLRVRNDGSAPMPCSPGFHPYFRLPAPGAARVFIPGPARIVPYDSTCTRLLPSPLPADSPPAVPHVYLASSPVATLQLPEHSFTLLFRHARARAGLAYWQPYSRPGAPFFCLEPWTAPAGAVNYGPPAFPPPIPPRQSRVYSLVVSLSR